MRRRQRRDTASKHLRAAEDVVAAFVYTARAARDYLSRGVTDADIAGLEAADGFRRLRPSDALAGARQALEEPHCPGNAEPCAVDEAIAAEWARQRSRRGGAEVHHAVIERGNP